MFFIKSQDGWVKYLIIRRRSRAVLDEMLISWDDDDDDGASECGPDHEDCAYSRAYPNAVVRLPDLGGNSIEIILA